ncbi:Intraflagellar transport protein 20 [Phytophthora citrophthora]|uniref:Intraflagellar transport protein 20 n=1 Tax=Phytophthora citrophthora TaxID=4793 RepID=A0AAD9LH46_9STRA|nr:Intraflagellar transport protein 20 [Phytophthora citrophthora]
MQVLNRRDLKKISKINMSRGDNQLPSVCFDDDCQVRVLDKENITHTQELEQESNQFATKLEEFHDIVKGVLEVMEGQAKRIEREKLKAIGQRNRVDSEVENRNRQKQMLELLIKEKKTELERYNLQFQSLTKIADEQQLLMDKLSNNES